MQSLPDLQSGQFAEWKARYEERKAAMRQAEREELGARGLQVRRVGIVRTGA